MGAYRSPQLTQQRAVATNTWDVLNIDLPYHAAGAESTEILKDASIHHSALVDCLLNNRCELAEAMLFRIDENRKSIASIY